MGPVSIREARRHFSDLVNAVEHGQTIIITRRGRRVACLSPAEEKPRALPDMAKFRESIKIKGKAMSRQIVEVRSRERF